MKRKEIGNICNKSRLGKGTARRGLRHNLLRKSWDRDGTGGSVQEERKEAMCKRRWVGPAPTQTETKTEEESPGVGGDVGVGAVLGTQCVA